jgi:hypothetical protein
VSPVELTNVGKEGKGVGAKYGEKDGSSVNDEYSPLGAFSFDAIIAGNYKN